MRRGLWRAWLPVIAVVILSGCEHSSGSRCPPDPLLLSKKPIESRSELGAATALAQREPRAPQSLFAAPVAPALPTSLQPDD
jgi:hypothetical protein